MLNLWGGVCVVCGLLKVAGIPQYACRQNSYEVRAEMFIFMVSFKRFAWIWPYTNSYTRYHLFDVHRQRCHVDCSCTVSCRRSTRGMCSMNTSSWKCNMFFLDKINGISPEQPLKCSLNIFSLLYYQPMTAKAVMSSHKP